MDTLVKAEAKIRRRKRVRKKIYGTAERPRLSVFRSNKHIYAQIIDDISGRTLATASTLDKEVKKDTLQTSNVEAAKKVGFIIAEKALKAKIDTVVFDRGSNLFHGRVKSLAEAAREAGLKF